MVSGTVQTQRRVFNGKQRLMIQGSNGLIHNIDDHRGDTHEEIFPRKHSIDHAQYCRVSMLTKQAMYIQMWLCFCVYLHSQNQMFYRSIYINNIKVRKRKQERFNQSSSVLICNVTWIGLLMVSIDRLCLHFLFWLVQQKANATHAK